MALVFYKKGMLEKITMQRTQLVSDFPISASILYYLATPKPPSRHHKHRYKLNMINTISLRQEVNQITEFDEFIGACL